MKKVVRLTESDLMRIVKRVIKEEIQSSQINFSSLQKPNSMDCESIFEKLDILIEQMISRVSRDGGSIDTEGWKSDISMSWDKKWVPHIEKTYNIKLTPTLNKCLKDKVVYYFDNLFK